MNIRKINLLNYSLYNTKTNYIKKYNSISDIKQDTVSFSSNTKNDNYKKITENGYKYFKDVEIINASGKPVKGHAFIKNIPNEHYKIYLKSLITDDNYSALGIVDAGTDLHDENYLLCDVFNYTDEVTHSFERSSDVAALNPSCGRYRHIGKNAYQALEEYVKTNHPEIKGFNVNAVNSASFDFHCSIGFDGQIGDYDCYSMTNFLRKNF